MKSVRIIGEHLLHIQFAPIFLVIIKQSLIAGFSGQQGPALVSHDCNGVFDYSIIHDAMQSWIYGGMKNKKIIRKKEGQMKQTNRQKGMNVVHVDSGKLDDKKRHSPLGEYGNTPHSVQVPCTLHFLTEQKINCKNSKTREYAHSNSSSACRC